MRRNYEQAEAQNGDGKDDAAGNDKKAFGDCLCRFVLAGGGSSFIPYIAIYFIIRQILAVYPDLSALGQTSLFSYGWMALGGVAANILLYFVALCVPIWRLSERFMS